MLNTIIHIFRDKPQTKSNRLHKFLITVKNLDKMQYRLEIIQF